MKFLIQHNRINPKNLLAIKNAIAPYPHDFIAVMSEDGDIVGSEPIEGIDYIPYGSSMLCDISAQRNWAGSHYDLRKLNYRAFLDNRTDMLNDTVMPISEAIEFLGKQEHDARWFARPSMDNKVIAGTVLGADELRTWFINLMRNWGEGSIPLQPDFEMVLSKPVKISAEWRWFIVGGKIVSGSMYLAHNQPRSMREIDASVIEEAQAIADIWLPHDSVVMDLALVDGAVKVIEFNCINASGFYDHDINAIFKALWERHQ